jgi:hypothetical protein
VREDREINTGNVHHMPRGNAFAGGFPRGGYAAVRGGFPGAFGGFAGGFDPYGFQQPFAHRGGFRGGYGGMPQVMVISSPRQADVEADSWVATVAAAAATAATLHCTALAKARSAQRPGTS